MPMKKQKCAHCAKKQLISFQCVHCEKAFCIMHKMPEFHDCKCNFQNKDGLKMEALAPVKVDKI